MLLAVLLLISNDLARAQVAPAVAAADSELSLQQIMADPQWIGHPVEQAWWSPDGAMIYYRQQRSDSSLRDVYALDLHSGGRAQRLPDAQRANINDQQPVFDDEARHALYLRQGDVWLFDRTDGSQRPLTMTTAAEQRLQFSADGTAALYQRDNAWYMMSLDDGVERLAADLRSEDDPDAEQEQDLLQQRQLELFSTLQKLQQQREAQSAQDKALHAAAEQVAAQPWYLGEQNKLVGSSLAPDGRHMLVVTTSATADAGRRGKMPDYVTASGYVDVQDVRTRVGANTPSAQQLWLLDLQQQQQYALDLSVLPGIDTDPLADLRKQQELPALEGLRDITVTGMQWHPSGGQVAVQLEAVDNKDRWIATVDFSTRTLQPRHRLTDPAWINWSFNDFGWLPQGQATAAVEVLWYLSEESGYAHLYTLALDRSKPRQRTSGNWEVSSPQPLRDGSGFYLIGNREQAAEYELYRLQLSGAEQRLTQLSDLDGVEGFTPSAVSQQILLQYSGSYLPSQLALIDVAAGTTTRLTDTRTQTFAALPWQPPQLVAVPSQHGAGQPIWSKLYLPDFAQHQGRRPVVLFVHGAGYTQNTHLRYPYYFREQMFHNLLTARGYIVLDMDYRASAGYGRDWRTAIYRQMGHPELEDLLDGIDWLAANYPADPQRVGVYGGSYGGFMTLMAMFRAPDRFTAGAALRPVTDWTAYNHPYTSKILNTPELDPQAYRSSSPIDHADGLQGHLLIAHGMLDDNVFYQDSVRLAQRLIELRKDHWELASYPLEAHGFEHSDSWYDEYRRILSLFERTINAPH
ncbi:MAG: S9 family peptidase [Wenzhouxiangellaceae bacterium]